MPECDHKWITEDVGNPDYDAYCVWCGVYGERCHACRGQGGHHAGADRHYEPVLCERCGGTGYAYND